MEQSKITKGVIARFEKLKSLRPHLLRFAS